METAQLRTELFNELTPILDSDWMMEKVVNFIKNLRLIQQIDSEQPLNNMTIPTAIRKWKGSVKFTKEEIDNDEKLATILQ